MAKLNLPFLLEQLDNLIDDELSGNQAEPGTEREFTLLKVLQEAVATHLDERLAAAGPNQPVSDAGEPTLTMLDVGEPYLKPDADEDNGYLDGTAGVTIPDDETDDYKNN